MSDKYAAALCMIIVDATDLFNATSQIPLSSHPFLLSSANEFASYRPWYCVPCTTATGMTLGSATQRTDNDATPTDDDRLEQGQSVLQSIRNPTTCGNQRVALALGAFIQCRIAEYAHLNEMSAHCDCRTWPVKRGQQSPCDNFFLSEKVLTLSVASQLVLLPVLGCKLKVPDASSLDINTLALFFKALVSLYSIYCIWCIWENKHHLEKLESQRTQKGFREGRRDSDVENFWKAVLWSTPNRVDP